ncbi:hypothetical protein [Paenarthrobacter aurescens]|uniref:hypothetical protein n=1 Tax=Paenarthrobacter aurescens TaxID=43663 RepID=UPI0031E34DB6
MSLYEVDVQRTGRRRTLRRWFLLHPGADFAWAAAAVLLWLGIALLARQPLMLEAADPGARRTLFQTLATLAGATAGLTLTSVSMLINVLGKKAPPGQQELPLEKLSAAHRRQIGEVFLFAIRGWACWWWLRWSLWSWKEMPSPACGFLRPWCLC